MTSDSTPLENNTQHSNQPDPAIQPHTRSKIQPWLVVFSASLLFFYGFMQMLSFNALSDPLMQTFSASAAQVASISVYYFYGNIILMLPAGILLDRFSPRKIILAMMAIMTIAVLGFAFSHTLFQAKVCRLMVGLAGAFCLLAAVRVATRWFPPQKMALIMGLVVTFAMLGGMVAQTPFTFLTDHIGWRDTLKIDALIGVVLFIIAFALVKDFPKGDEAKIKQEKTQLQSIGFWTALFSAIKNFQNWAAGIYTALLNLPVMILGGIWGIAYLAQARHLTRTQASVVTMMIFIGAIVGSPVMGWISDHLQKRKLPMIVGGFISLAVILVIIYTPTLNFTALCVLFLILGFITMSQVISYPLIAESNPSSLVGTASGFSSILIMGAGTSQSVFGWMMGLHWDHKIVNGTHVYSTANYNFAMISIIIAFVIGLIAAFFIKETHCKPLVK